MHFFHLHKDHDKEKKHAHGHSHEHHAHSAPPQEPDQPVTKDKPAPVQKTAPKKAAKEEEEDPFAEWDVSNELGRGGFAVVHKATRKGEKEGQAVALRIVPLSSVLIGPTVWTVEDLKKRLEWVKRIHRDDPSPYILRFIDYKIAGPNLISFSELCRGGDLFSRILDCPDGHYNEEDAREAMASICKGVAHAHKIGSIHRDIKPENILYKKKDSPPGDLVIMDFGCAIPETTREAYHDGIIGSPGYMAPEMCADKSYRMIVDEWSVGVVAYEILTGRSPLAAESAEELRLETVERNIPYPSTYWKKISPQAKDFTKRFLDKNPETRMTVEQALDHPWLAGTAHLERKDSGASEMSLPDTTVHIATSKTRRMTMAKPVEPGADKGVVESAMGIVTGADHSEVFEADTMAVLRGEVSASDLEALQHVVSTVSTASSE